MAFKTVNNYNESRYGNTFLLRNDGDYADVIFLYRNIDDVLVADTHYIKSNDYTGYVHCCGKGCPACHKGIRVQTKLFIPMYNITDHEIQFWDRTMRFEPQLQNDVFRNFSNPSEYVFRITRHGVPHDVNTSYEILAIGTNTVKTYDQILSENDVKNPDYYNMICKEFSTLELQNMINSYSNNDSSKNDSLPDYQVKPRSVINNNTSVKPDIPETPMSDSIEDLDTDISEIDDVDF